jgi:uncharacterized coiled-coil protein SlyX
MNPVADATHQPSTGPELRAQRLGSALRNLAADLVDERRKVARLRREIADLRAQLKSLEPTHHGDKAPAPPA